MQRELSGVKEAINICSCIIYTNTLTRNERFVIYSDSSKNGLGCELMHDGKVIAYALRQLKEYEKNYLMCVCSTDLETLFVWRTM